MRKERLVPCQLCVHVAKLCVHEPELGAMFAVLNQCQGNGKLSRIHFRMASIGVFLILLFAQQSRIGAEELSQNLLAGAWTFRNRSDNQALKPLSGSAVVPGDIYADLQ